MHLEGSTTLRNFLMYSEGTLLFHACYARVQGSWVNPNTYYVSSCLACLASCFAMVWLCLDFLAELLQMCGLVLYVSSSILVLVSPLGHGLTKIMPSHFHSIPSCGSFILAKSLWPWGFIYPTLNCEMSPNFSH